MDLAPHLTNLSFNFSLQPLFSHNLRNSDPTKTLLYADNQRQHNAASCVLFLEKHAGVQQAEELSCVGVQCDIHISATYNFLNNNNGITWPKVKCIIPVI